MSLATALQDQLAHNPWPPAAQQVIFLLDTTRRFERQLLEQWIATHDNSSTDHTIVLLDLRDDRKTLNVEKLSEALQQHPDAMVAPLRVSWLQAERSPSTGVHQRVIVKQQEIIPLRRRHSLITRAQKT